MCQQHAPTTVSLQTQFVQGVSVLFGSFFRKKKEAKDDIYIMVSSSVLHGLKKTRFCKR
jgi:predicted nucleotidyltransferase